MKRSSMTALTSAFARAYHAQNNTVKIFDDSLAHKLLTPQEYTQISKSMAEGISFFHPTFSGTPEDALRWVVDTYLSPAPLARAAWAEKALQTAVRIGTRQYCILGAGYDTFAYRQPEWAHLLQIFELEHPATAADKQNRLCNAQISIPENVQCIPTDFTKEDWVCQLSNSACFRKERLTFCSLLGLVYYLPRQSFRSLLSALRLLLPEGSTLVFDYPDQDFCTPLAGERAKKQSSLAGAANESMLAGYSYGELEQLLSACGFLIYEHLTPEEMTRQYFSSYNEANPLHPMAAFDNTNYCLAVAKSII